MDNDAREELGISQKGSGRKDGISRQSVNSIENGKYDPSLPLAIRIARFLGSQLKGFFMSQNRDLKKVEFDTAEPVYMFGEQLCDLCTCSTLSRATGNMTVTCKQVSATEVEVLVPIWNAPPWLAFLFPWQCSSLLLLKHYGRWGYVELYDGRWR